MDARVITSPQGLGYGDRVASVTTLATPHRGSKVADVVQCAVDGKGDHILAARFLNRFVPEEIPWVHVDLSSATRTGGLGHINTEVTGFGVRYALELILKHDILAAAGRQK